MLSLLQNMKYRYVRTVTNCVAALPLLHYATQGRS